MNFKWFRMLFAPLNGDLRQICLRRTAPQSKIISRNLKQIRFVSTLQHQSKMDIIRKNADLLDEISKKAKFPLERTEVGLKQKMAPFLRSRPSSRCFLRKSASAPRRDVRSFYLGQAQNKLSKKMSNIERFHQIYQENCTVSKSAPSIGTPCDVGCISTPKMEDRSNFLSRPTTRRMQVCEFSNWSKPVYPSSPWKTGNDLGDNLNLVKKTIKQTIAEYATKNNQLCNVAPVKSNHAFSGYMTAAGPFLKPEFKEKIKTNRHDLISLRKSSKTVDLASMDYEDPDYTADTFSRDLKKCVFAPSQVKLNPDIVKNIGKIKHVKKTHQNTHEPFFQLVKNPHTGKLDIKDARQGEFKVNAPLKRVPIDVGELSFKEQFMAKLTPAQCYRNQTTRQLTEADYAELLQAKKKPVLKTKINKNKLPYYMLIDEKPKLIWQRHLKKQKSLERWQQAREIAQATLLEKKKLKHAVPALDLTETPDQNTEDGDYEYGRLPVSVYKSFCEIAKKKNLFTYVPRTTPKLKIKFPMYAAHFKSPRGWAFKASESVDGPKDDIPVKDLKEVRRTKVRRTSSGGSGRVGSWNSNTTKVPKGLLGMCRYSSKETLPGTQNRRECRNAHALYSHRPKTKISVTHNIKKPGTATATAIQQQVYKSYRLSQGQEKDKEVSKDDFDKKEEVLPVEDKIKVEGVPPVVKSCSEKGPEPKTIEKLVEPKKNARPVCKVCGLFHSQFTNGKCPLTYLLKKSDYFGPQNPGVKTMFKRTYSTSTKGIPMPTTADELLHECKYCGMVHSSPGHVCPFNEALKLFTSNEEEKGFKLIHPIGVKVTSPGAVAVVPQVQVCTHCRPTKEDQLKRLKQLQNRLNLLSNIKQAVVRKMNTERPVIYVPPSKKLIPVDENKTELKSIVKRYNKNKISNTMKAFVYGKQLKGEELIKFSKSLGGLLRDLLQECHAGLKLNENAQIVKANMNFVVRKTEDQLNHYRRFSGREIHDDPPSFIPFKNSEFPETITESEPQLKLDKSFASERKGQVCTSVHKTVEDSRKTRYSFEISCKKITSTRNNSTSGNRNFNTSCAHNTPTKETTATPLESQKRKSQNIQSAQIHKSMCVENIQTKVNPKQVEVTSYPKYNDPKVTENWMKYKSYSEVKKLESEKNLGLPLKKVVSKCTPEDIREKKRKYCINLLQNQVDRVEYALRKTQTEANVANPQTFRIAVGYIPNTREDIEKSTVKPVDDGKFMEIGQNLKPKSSSLTNLVPNKFSCEKKILKVLLKEEPPVVEKIEKSKRESKIFQIPLKSDSKKVLKNSTLSIKPSGLMGSTIKLQQSSSTSAAAIKNFFKTSPKKDTTSNSKKVFKPEDTCPPPSCLNCSSGPGKCADRKLCAQNENLQKTILDLMKVENPCEFTLLQARMRRQREKLQSQNKEEEFFKGYRCAIKRSNIYEVSDEPKQKPYTPDKVFPVKRMRSSGSCSGSYNSQLADTRCLHFDQNKSQKILKEKTDNMERKSFDSHNCKKFSSGKENKVFGTESHFEQMKSRRLNKDKSDVENTTFVSRTCRKYSPEKRENKVYGAQSHHDAMKSRRLTKDEKDAEKDTFDSRNCRKFTPERKGNKVFDVEKYYNKDILKEKKENEGRKCYEDKARQIKELQKMQESKYTPLKKNAVFSKEKCKAKEEEEDDDDDSPRMKQSVNNCCSGRTPRPKAEKYQFQKPSTETIYEFVTEDYRSEAQKKAENRFRENASKKQTSLSKESGRGSSDKISKSKSRHDTEKSVKCFPKQPEKYSASKQVSEEDSERNMQHFSTKYKYKDHDEDEEDKTLTRDSQKYSESKHASEKDFQSKPIEKNFEEQNKKLEEYSVPRPIRDCEEQYLRMKSKYDTEKLRKYSPYKPRTSQDSQRTLDSCIEEVEEDDRKVGKKLAEEKKKTEKRAEHQMGTKVRKSLREEIDSRSKRSTSFFNKAKKSKSLLIDDEDFESDKTSYTDVKLLKKQLEKEELEMRAKSFEKADTKKVVPVYSTEENYADNEERVKTPKEEIRSEVTTPDIVICKTDKQKEKGKDLELQKSVHLCYDKDQLQSISEKTLKCKEKSTPITEILEHENPEGSMIKEHDITHSKIPSKSVLPNRRREQEARLEPIRSERNQYVDKEIKKLENLQKEIKFDDAKRLFYQEQLRDVRKQIAEFEAKLSGDSLSVSPPLTPEISDKLIDYRKSLDLKICPEVMSLRSSTDVIADKVYERLLKASNNRILNEVKEEILNSKSIDVDKPRTGIHVCKPNGSVTELSMASTIGDSADSRRPQKKWTQKISSAMHSVTPEVEEINTPECMSKKQMEMICNKVLEEINKLNQLKVKEKEEKKKETALIRKSEDKVMIKESESSRKWKYLDELNHYDYTHYEKSTSGLQLQKCMKEVKKCLDDYKRCLIDLKLMPQMDKHFDYDTAVSISSPNLPISRENDSGEDNESITSDNSILEKIRKSTKVERKCSSKLNTVPMLISGQHPINIKHRKSTTCVLDTKNRHQYSVDKRHFGDSMTACLNEAGVSNLKDSKTRKSSETGVGVVIDEATLCFPRGEANIDVELLFHPNEDKIEELKKSRNTPETTRNSVPEASQNNMLDVENFPVPKYIPNPHGIMLHQNSPTIRYDYTSYNKQSEESEEEETEPIFSKPIQMFHQMYEVTTNKLKSMAQKTDEFLNTPDELWSEQYYPQIYHKKTETQALTQSTTGHSKPPQEKYYDKNMGLLTARIIARPKGTSPNNCPHCQIHHTRKTLERQQSLTNIFKEARQDFQESSKKCCKDLKETLRYPRGQK